MATPWPYAGSTRPGCTHRVAPGGGVRRPGGSIGFTLVEMLVVITIILVLSSLLLLVGVPAFTDMVNQTVLRRRSEQIVSGLMLYRAGEDRTLGIINGANATELRFASLREVLLRLTAKPPAGCGLDLATPTRDYLPPNLGTRYEAYARAQKTGYSQAFKDAYRVTSSRLEDVITFRNRMLNTRQDVRACTGGLPENPISVGIGWMADHYADVPNMSPLTYPNPVFNVKVTFEPYDARNSPLGETLDATFEVLPTGGTPWPTQAFKDRWPNLIQTKVDALLPVGGKVFINRSWQASDWPLLGKKPVLWPFPWGGKIVRRFEGLVAVEQKEGLLPPTDPLPAATWTDLIGNPVPRLQSDGQTLAPAYLELARSVDVMSPLSTLRLLAMSSQIAPGASGAESYRSQRNRNQPWNDRWGGALVLGFSAFIAPRYDFDDDNEKHLVAFSKPQGRWIGTQSVQSPDPVVLTSDRMLGGRDLLMKTLKRDYGAAWEAYLSLGVTGPDPVLSGGAERSWTDAAEDGKNLIARWNLVTTTCAAWDWDQRAFAAPPGAWTRSDPDGGKWKVDAWSKNGFRKGVRGNGQTCYLMSPVPIR